jgi:plastocyanin
MGTFGNLGNLGNLDNLGNLGNDLANSIINAAKDKVKEGCTVNGGSTVISSQSSSSSSGSSSMISSSSSNGNSQSVISNNNGHGKSTICGGQGNDILSGGSGDDIIYGGKGNDKLFGNAGNDILIGGPGADHFDCGPGNDTIKDFNPSEGDTKTNDCENVIYANSNGQSTTSSPKSYGSEPTSNPITKTKPAIANNVTGSENSIIKPLKPIVPAGSVMAPQKEAPVKLASKNTSTKSLTLIAVNKSKVTNVVPSTSDSMKNISQERNSNSSIQTHLGNNSTAKTNATKIAAIAQSLLRPINITTGLANPAPQFSPSLLNIKSGQKVIWSNPATVPDPHTITFVLNNQSAVSLIIPLIVSNSSQIKPVTSGENNMPLIRHDPGKPATLLVINSRAIEPIVIGQNGLASKIVQKNSTGYYKVLGTEKYINSGWLLPKGLERGYPGALTSFEVTFSKPGIYHYADVFHPWMKGTIIVN